MSKYGAVVSLGAYLLCQKSHFPHVPAVLELGKGRFCGGRGVKWKVHGAGPRAVALARLGRRRIGGSGDGRVDV